ncbi:nicotinate-nucleotide-dimethylbenzimidazole phosphoribosyltransferase [Dethiosulfatibacter aminovorans DSM 17477]|uniref:Nicotinate-nucleotide--dimethylbenzimidazole phosphoribosyltransferase n=1 Tax=Dethiosulfatibacter aminovorans DSM 17477 TaxID=1121476 RepID=A0A1M6I1T3_9FIRM|nr:nicotinate-nucleotide--dimethylbenzimidazole phosphoribosyltransferase [Dethiosulfatibacter aminovorans]SHJ28429.1 nicotinate-nucleotide-dimethylbenzimidazole phosphoribosyltransferase [Dethiosulfatibacter aminovorans DSM 17477]
MELLKRTVERIEGLNEDVMKECRDRVDNLIKPQGSLGKLEDLAVQMSGITGEMFPVLDNKAIIVMAADHGVCDEGVASAPQVVTVVQTYNIPKGITGVGALAAVAGADLVTVDIGVQEDLEYGDTIINKKVKYGTDNMTKGPAMTYEEAVKALETGIEVAESEIKKGRKIIGTGEMGIGNTTPSTAILSVLGEIAPEEITGIGANLDASMVENKANVIRRAIALNCPDKKDPIDVLAKVGGLDIAGMAGTMLGCAANKTPCIVDGYISTMAALIACAIEPKTKNYLVTSHFSKEKGAKTASELLGLTPMLDMNMRLGEGSGAVLVFNIIDAAINMNKAMITFQEGGIGVV